MNALRAAVAAGMLIACALCFAASAQTPSELLVRNGLIVTATGRTQGDVRVRAGTIVEIGRNLTPAAAARVIDATGKLVLPGGIDPHVHLGLRPGIQGSDDYTTGSRAALAGGITTIANFINQAPNEALAVTMSKAADEVKREAIGRRPPSRGDCESRRGDASGPHDAGGALHAEDLHVA